MNPSEVKKLQGLRTFLGDYRARVSTLPPERKAETLAISEDWITHILDPKRVSSQELEFRLQDHLRDLNEIRGPSTQALGRALTGLFVEPEKDSSPSG